MVDDAPNRRKGRPAAEDDALRALSTGRGVRPGESVLGAIERWHGACSRVALREAHGASPRTRPARGGRYGLARRVLIRSVEGAEG